MRWNELLLQPELNGQPIPGATLEQLYVALSERGWRISQKPAEDAVLRVTKGKTYNTRGGVKEETDPRWLEAVAVDNSTFGLVENWDQLKLPPTVSGKTLGAVLRRLPYWQQLMAEYKARGEWLCPYSLHDKFSVRSHGIVKDDTLIAAAMGQTVEVHHRS